MSHAGEPVQIAVIRSTDGGQTWSSPSQVNDVVPDRQWNYPEVFPDIAVAPDGRVDVRRGCCADPLSPHGLG